MPIAIADARGPRVIAAYPVPGAIGVGPGQALSVRFDENVPASSVTSGSLRLFVNGHSVRGALIRKGPRLLKFNPTNPLKKGRVYTAVVAYGLEDKLGKERVAEEIGLGSAYDYQDGIGAALDVTDSLLAALGAPVAVDTAFASSVLPTPAGPSTRSGLFKRSASNTPVAMASSDR